MEYSHCGHFSVEVEELIVPQSGVVLRIPIRRCALAERMITLLGSTEEGRDIALKVAIASTRDVLTEPGSSALNTEADKLRVAFGPDLEAIHPFECTAQRCKTSCTPSFKLLLEHFEFHDVANEEIGKGCEEKAEKQSAAVLLYNDM